MALRLSLPRRFNLAEHLLSAACAAEQGAGGERPYLVCGEEALSVAQAEALSHRAAHALRALGLRRGARVALLLREGLDFAGAFWGAIRAGLVPVPLNPALPPADHAFYLDDCRAAVLLVEATLLPALLPRLDGLRNLRRIAPVGAAWPAPDATAARVTAPWAHLLAAAPDTPFATERDDPDASAFWLYTSGSTARPKAAIHRHRDALYVAETYLRHVLRLAPGELSFSAAKSYFAYGLGNSLLFPLAAGCAALLQPEPATGAGCLAALARYRPQAFHAVPALYHALLEHHEALRAAHAADPRAEEPPRLEHLRVATSGGEALPTALLERWRAAFGLPILDGVGSTEALHFYLANAPDAHRPGSSGRPVPGYDVRLMRRGGREAGPGEVGELWVRGGSVLARYWRRPAATRRALREGWLRTGDRFLRDAEGWYWFQGRADDVFKAGGSWVNPLEVERVLLEHPAVADCAVVGRRNGAGLGEGVACVVPRGGVLAYEAAAATLSAALRAHAAERLAAFKVPARVEFHAALPRTATGKLRRHRLRTPSEGA